MHQNMFNQSSSQDKTSLNLGRQKQGTPWQHNNDSRLSGSQIGMNDVNNLGARFNISDTNNYGVQLGVNDTNNYDAQFDVNDTSNNDAQFQAKNTNNHDDFHVDTFNSPAINAFQNNFGRNLEDTNIPSNKQSPSNDANVGFNSSNISPLYYPQDKNNGMNNQYNLLHQELLPSFGFPHSIPNPIYNNQDFLQEKGSNIQGVFQEYGLGSNFNPQRTFDTTNDLHHVAPQQGFIHNLGVKNNNLSTSSPPQQSYFNPYSYIESPNAISKSQNYLQKTSSSNPSGHEIINKIHRNFHSNISKSEGSIPNLNYSSNPHGMNTTYNPHGILPTLNITFSPAFHNSPSTIPTTPKSQVESIRLNTSQDSQCIDQMNVSQPLPQLNLSHPLETNIIYPPQSKSLDTQINIPNNASNIPISTISQEHSFNTKNNPQQSKQHSFVNGEALTSTSNCTLTRDVTPSPCLHAYCQDNLASNPIDSKDFHANNLKCKNKRRASNKKKLEDLDDQNSDSDYDGSLTPPSTRKRVLHLASKKLKYLRNLSEDNNDANDSVPMWIQKTIVLPAQRRGCHNITHLLTQHLVMDLAFFKCGLAFIFLQDSSASLTINEIGDIKLIKDIDLFTSEGRTSKCSNLHGEEGYNDMVGHVKSTIFGCSLTIPITNGFLNMGKCQAICLCERQKYGTCHRIVVTLNGT